METKRATKHLDKKLRRIQAEERQSIHNGLSLQQKLDKLATRPGAHKRESAKFAAVVATLEAREVIANGSTK